MGPRDEVSGSLAGQGNPIIGISWKLELRRFLVLICLKLNNPSRLQAADCERDGTDFPSSNSLKMSQHCESHEPLGKKSRKEEQTQGLHNVLDQETIKVWNNLYESTDAYTDRWLSSARTFLEQLSGGNRISTPHPVSPVTTVDSTDMKCRNINVLVTSGSLIPSLVKCLLFRLNDFISHENVYSSWEVGKLQCFSWIKERFGGQAVKYCAIGDGPEECEAAQTMGWPFIGIDLRPGGSNRFPGLTMKTANYYLDVIYGGPDVKKDEQCL